MKIILKKKKKINSTLNEKIINLENEKTQIENISKILDDDINQKNKKTIARLSKKIDSYEKTINDQDSIKKIKKKQSLKNLNSI